jgi:hypothetical protein
MLTNSRRFTVHRLSQLQAAWITFQDQSEVDRWVPVGQGWRDNRPNHHQGWLTVAFDHALCAPRSATSLRQGLFFGRRVPSFDEPARHASPNQSPGPGGERGQAVVREISETHQPCSSTRLVGVGGTVRQLGEVFVYEETLCRICRPAAAGLVDGARNVAT